MAHALLGSVVIVAALVAVFSERLVASAVALAVGNTALALLLVLIGASVAGVIQLSVGVGVLSALFLVAITLTERMGQRPTDGET
ncbi:MAG: hypothetical protein ACYCYF_13045 [Anaerolineae bacterium]